MQPDISIITPWLDHPEFIEDYEKAVRAPGVEVIAVDNGSASINATLIQRMIDRLAGKYIRNEANCWFSAANNQGLAVANGRIVLFMNNDIAAEPGWLDDVRHQVSPGGLFSPSAQKTRIEQNVIAYLEGWCIAGRMEVWKALRGWDEQLFKMPYWEDADLSLRAAGTGFTLNQVNWRVTHKKNGTSSYVPGILYGFEHNRQALTARLRGQIVPAATGAGQSLEPLERYLQSGRLPEAEMAFQRAVQLHPGDARLWQTYGQTLRLCGRFQPAIDAQQRAMELDPATTAEAFREIGLNYHNMRENAKAADAFAKLVELKPESADARVDLAMLLNACARYADAAEAADTAIRLAPNDPAGHVQSSVALLRLGRHPEARAAAERAVHVNAQHPAGYHALGAALKSAGLLDEALRAYDRASELDPHSWAIHSEREELRKQRGQGKSASQ